MYRCLLGLTLWFFAGSVFSQILPREDAARFCRLLVNDGERIMPLSAHAKQVMEPTDSLTQEQLFANFILRDGNWKTLCFFPHPTADGTVVWYAPAEELPASLGPEHQKYIREVFPRLLSEVEAGNWANVDTCINRMIQYQCTFGSVPKESTPILPMALGALFSFVCVFLLPSLRLPFYGERSDSYKNVSL